MTTAAEGPELSPRAGQREGHHYIYRPGTDGRAPLVLLHGTGGDERDLLALGAQLTPGRSLLAPRGNVSEQGANRFFRRLAEGVFDEADLHARTEALHRFLAATAEAEDFALADITLLGFSNGANIAAAYLLRGFPADGAILLRAMRPFALPPETPPADHPARILLLNGAQDALVPAESHEALAASLRRIGHTVESQVVEAGHGLVRADLAHAQRYFRQT
ncbi:MAG: alpha/beta hydrolase [Verrucomicrobiota bacterium]